MNYDELFSAISPEWLETPKARRFEEDSNTLYWHFETDTIFIESHKDSPIHLVAWQTKYNARCHSGQVKEELIKYHLIFRVIFHVSHISLSLNRHECRNSSEIHSVCRPCRS